MNNYPQQYTSVENLVTRYFVRYDRMDELISYAYAGSKANTINIFIDLYGIYHSLFSRHYTTTITDYTSFVSLIVNMCIHYRSYFKGMNVYSKIFLISSYNLPEHTLKVIPDYNHTMQEKLQNKTVGEMLELNDGLLELLCPYLPDIFFIKTAYESSVVMSKIIDQELARTKIVDKYSVNPSLIISTDILPIQLCYQKENVSYIWPRKVMGNDISLICTNRKHLQFKNDFWSVITQKSENSMPMDKVHAVSPFNLVILQSLSRLKQRDMKALYNITGALKIIKSLPLYDSMEVSIDDVLSKVDDSRKDIFLNRYRALNTEYQLLMYNESVEAITLHYENLQDPEAVRMINDKYFRDNPIDIFRL